jgi:6-phosphofructokinase 1
VKFGVLTGGGDCSGLNAAIRGVVLRASQKGHTTLGFLDGWKGVRDDLARPLNVEEVRGVVGTGGTILGTSRTNPFQLETDAQKVTATLARRGIDGLIAIGGDDTLSAARELARRGGRVVGVPKTMDNDVSATDHTFGFDSASTVAMDALERLRDTARSHHRVIVLEVMGRSAGWVAVATGIGGGADVTLVPEETWDEAKLLASVQRAVAARGYAVVVTSEAVDPGVPSGEKAARDQFGHELLRERGVGATIARRIEERLGVETRSAQIGHIQRGGPPTLFDRLLASRLGVYAVDLALEGRWGEVAVSRGETVIGVPLDEAIGVTKRVSTDWLDLLHALES